MRPAWSNLLAPQKETITQEAKSTIKSIEFLELLMKLTLTKTIYSLYVKTINK